MGCAELTLADAISRVDGIEPNAYTNEQKAAWVSECEGKVYTEVFLLTPYEFHPLTYAADASTELAVMPPHDKLYPLYLQAMVLYANGEYDRYTNAMALFNSAWGEFVRWFARVYSPAEGYPKEDA